jgi:hypothetical protein
MMRGALNFGRNYWRAMEVAARLRKFGALGRQWPFDALMIFICSFGFQARGGQWQSEGTGGVARQPIA